MASNLIRFPVMISLSLTLAGSVAGAAWSYGLWLAVTGAMLVSGWLVVLNLLFARRTVPVLPSPASATERDFMLHGLLLDASPTPLVLVDGGSVRALNRSARTLFGTDNRVLPTPPSLLDAEITHLRHAGRSWRADRVDVGTSTVVALIDVESEERTAEARASAEMIQVLGHEMLNGLVPIVSLAECGIVAADDDGDPALLRDILNTLARRAEGLQRFTEAYRSLARLPEPLKQTVAVAEMIDDLARLFASRWPDAVLSINVQDRMPGHFDRDQVSQALWALLQNAVEAASVDPATLATICVTVMTAEATLIFDISDNGPGVTPEQVTAIFRPFVTTKPSGTGIGLSLARQVALAHGGTLELIPADATTFRLQLPDGSAR